MTNTIKSLIGALIILIMAYSCKKENSFNNDDLDKPHDVKIFLTDHATPVFDSVFIDIRELELKLNDDSLGNDVWIAMAINPGIYNILTLRNGLDTLFASGTLPNARIKKLKLTLGKENSVMKNNRSFPLHLHDKDRDVVVNIDESNFEITSPGQILFWLDIDAGRSI